MYVFISVKLHVIMDSCAFFFFDIERALNSYIGGGSRYTEGSTGIKMIEKLWKYALVTCQPLYDLIYAGKWRGIWLVAIGCIL